MKTSFKLVQLSKLWRMHFFLYFGPASYFAGQGPWSQRHCHRDTLGWATKKGRGSQASWDTPAPVRRADCPRVCSHKQNFTSHQVHQLCCCPWSIVWCYKHRYPGRIHLQRCFWHGCTKKWATHFTFLHNSQDFMPSWSTFLSFFHWCLLFSRVRLSKQLMTCLPAFTWRFWMRRFLVATSDLKSTLQTMRTARKWWEGTNSG